MACVTCFALMVWSFHCDTPVAVVTSAFDLYHNDKSEVTPPGALPETDKVK